MTIYFNLASIGNMMAEPLVPAINFLGREVIRFTTHSIIPVAIIVTALALAALAISVCKFFI